jgi:hypothetical protein
MPIWPDPDPQHCHSLNKLFYHLNIYVCSGGDILVNPELPQAHSLLGWWDDKGKRTASFSSITVQVHGQLGFYWIYLNNLEK